MNKSKKIFFQQFENWVLADIRYLLELDKGATPENADRAIKNQHRPFVASVILTCCAIDCLAAFWSGRENDNIGETFKGFVGTYFTSEVTESNKSYDKSQVYDGLRNALLHGYSLSHDIALSHTDQSLHLTIVDGHLVIDVYMLYFDLVKAYEKYKRELINGEYEESFKKRWDYAPLVTYFPEKALKL